MAQQRHRPLAVRLALAVLSFTALAAGASETLSVAGLNQTVEILKDRWGVSHIYAKNESDLFFAQGYNVARDRLFQLELWRRQATGTMAGSRGKRNSGAIRATGCSCIGAILLRSLTGIIRTVRPSLKRLCAVLMRILMRAEKHPALLTQEFAILGIKPAAWTPAVVISRFNSLLSNLNQELNMALAIRTVGADRVTDLTYFQPANPSLSMDPAIDASLLSKNILDLYQAFREPLPLRQAIWWLPIEETQNFSL